MACPGLCRAERDPGGAGGGRIARPLAAAPAGREATGGRAVLAVPHAGKTAGSSAQRRAGHAAVCPAVGGARLPRGQSGAAVPECRAAAGAGDRAQLDGKRSSKRIPAGVRCITAHWWKKTLQQHTLEFAGGGTAFLDFNGVQYHSYLRSTHTSVQGERGEVFDDTLRCLDAAGEPVCRQLTPLPDPLAAAAAQAGLNEDETAIACFLDRMQGYLAGGAEVYPLADALQDAYLAPADGARPCRPRSVGGKHPAAVEYRRRIKKAQEHLSAPLSLLIYNDWITSGRSVLPPRPCGWPSWWRCAPRCGCRRTFPRSRTLPCLPAQPAGCFPAQGRSGWWGSP